MRKCLLVILFSIIFTSLVFADPDINRGKTIFAQQNTTSPVSPYQVNVDHTDNGDGTITISTLSSTGSTTGATSQSQLFTYGITPRVNTITSSATPTIDANTTDVFTITALAMNITSMSSGLSGTYLPKQKLIITFLDDGTARTITWGAKYKSISPLPTTTIISKKLVVGLVYDSISTLWECWGSVQE